MRESEERFRPMIDALPERRNDTHASNGDGTVVSDSSVPLEAVLRTEELIRRPARLPDYATENRALAKLVQALADAPHTILQTLTDTILEVFQAGSAGISLLAKDETNFYWPAITGAWSAHVGGGTPRDFGPCGDVLDCSGPLLFHHPERRYTYFQPVQPAVEEALLVPFSVAGKAVGTIWAIAHDDRRRFDAEDLRLLESLGRFAAAAYRVVESTEDAVQTRRALEVVNEDLRAGEERYRTLFDLSPVGIYSIDASGMIQKYNSQAVKLWGRTPVPGDTDERFCGSFKLYRPDGTFMPHDQCPMAEMVSGKIAELLDAEVQIERLDGSRITVIVNIRPLKNGRGEIAGAINCLYDITARKLAEEALRAGEEFNRSIIESSPDCIKVLDLDGNLLSMQCGLELLGIEDISPYLNKSWVDFWQGDDRVAARAAVERAGHSARGGAANFVGYFRTLRGEPKWWDVAISAILNASGQPTQLLAVSRDVTDRKRTELNLAFIASVNQDLARFTGVDEMIRTVGAKIGAYLNLSLCAFVEIDEAADEVVIFHDWHRDDVPGLVGVHRLADFVEGDFIRAARAGEMIVVRDAAADPRTTPEKFAALKIGSFLCAPLLRDGQWRFALCLYHSAAYDWRADEIELARELTARIWTQLEHLRAETALHESEERYRTLFDSIDEGFCVIEMIFDERNHPVDYRFLEVNPTFARQTGLHEATGKRMRELVPDLEEHWFEIYGNVALTGEPVRSVNESKLMDGRWFDFYACRVGDPHSRKVAIVFNDISERLRAERLLRQNRDTFFNLIENAPFGVYVLDAEFRMRQVSHASRKAFESVRPLIGRDFAEVVRTVWPDPFATEAIGHFRHTLNTGEPFAMPNSTEQRLDGPGVESYDWKVERITLPDGQYGVVCYFYDISERTRTEDALRASQSRLRHAANAAGLTYVEVDLASGGARTAENFEAVMGYAPPPEQETDVTVGTRLLLEHIVPDDRPSVEAALRDFTAGHRIGKIEYRVLGDDRIERHIESEWFIESDSNGQPLKSFATNLDVTERKRAEQKFRGLLESAPDAMVIIDGEGRISLINAQTETLFGYTRDELIGQSVEVLIPQRFHDRHPGHRHGFFGDPKLRPMGAGQELWAARRDGTEFQVEISLSPLETEAGILVTAAIRDITERKRAEVLLRQNHDTFYNLIENSPFGLYIVDPQFRMIKVSAASQNVFRNIHPLIGRDFEEIMTILWPEEFVRLAIGRFRHTLDTGEPFAMPNFSEQRRDNAEIESYDWKIERITLPDGQFGVVCYFYDITERKLTEKQMQEQTAALAEADRRKNEFLAMLAHELRNPLAPIRNAAQALQRADGSGDAVRSAAAMIGRQVAQMVRLVDDLLDVSRVSRGKIELRRERVELASAVNHAVEAALALYESRNHDLTVALPPQPVYLNADPTRIAQVVGNLLNNACKFTDDGGRIRLTVEREGEVAVIRVRDSGIGIAADQLPRIFDMFTQIDTSIGRSVSGLGIGLTLVKNLVEMHDGTVDVHSAGVGRGSEFVVRLPVAVEAPEPPPARTAAAPPAATARRILVVDDNRDSAESLAMLLELAGNETHTAFDGLEAVAAAAAFRPDVVLCDIGLPKLNGYEVAREIRERPRGEKVVLVALTGWGQAEDRQKSRDAGFDAHMVKPVDFAALMKVLAETGASAPPVGSAG